MTTDNLVRGQTNSADQLTAAGTNHAGEPTADELDRAWGGTPPKTKTQTEMIRLQKAIKVNQAQQARLMLQAYRLAVRLFRLREKQAAIVATNKTAFVSRGRFAAKSPGGGLRFTSSKLQHVIAPDLGRARSAGFSRPRHVPSSSLTKSP